MSGRKFAVTLPMTHPFSSRHINFHESFAGLLAIDLFAWGVTVHWTDNTTMQFAWKSFSAKPVLAAVLDCVGGLVVERNLRVFPLRASTKVIPSDALSREDGVDWEKRRTAWPTTVGEDEVPRRAIPRVDTFVTPRVAYWTQRILAWEHAYGICFSF